MQTYQPKRFSVTRTPEMSNGQYLALTYGINPHRKNDVQLHAALLNHSLAEQLERHKSLGITRYYGGE